MLAGYPIGFVSTTPIYISRSTREGEIASAERDCFLGIVDVCEVGGWIEARTPLSCQSIPSTHEDAKQRANMQKFSFQAGCEGNKGAVEIGTLFFRKWKIFAIPQKTAWLQGFVKWVTRNSYYLFLLWRENCLICWAHTNLKTCIVLHIHLLTDIFYGIKLGSAQLIIYQQICNLLTKCFINYCATFTLFRNFYSRIHHKIGQRWYKLFFIPPPSLHKLVELLIVFTHNIGYSS